MLRRYRKSLARNCWPIIKPLTSALNSVGISAGKHSISTSRVTISKTPPCCFHAGGFAEGVHRNFDAHAHVHGDAKQIHMEQVAGDRIDEPIFQDGGFVLAAEIHLEQSVVAALGTEDRAKLLGVDRQGDGFALAAIQHGRNFAGQPQPARFVFAALGARGRFHYDFFLSHLHFLPWCC